jgi:hypothetical protein
MECLPIELIMVSIFDYLSSLDACFALYNLNTRLNNILQNQVIYFDLTHCRRSWLNFVCKRVLSDIRNPFSISFSLRPIVGSADRIFDKLKSNNVDHLLQSLTLVHATEQSINIVVPHLSRLMNLRSLTIILDPEPSEGKFLATILNTNMPLLTCFKID